MPDLKKTTICKKWKRGLCPLPSESCEFAHGEQELRMTRAFEQFSVEKQHAPAKAAKKQGSKNSPSLTPADDPANPESSSQGLPPVVDAGADEVPRVPPPPSPPAEGFGGPEDEGPRPIQQLLTPPNAGRPRPDPYTPKKPSAQEVPADKYLAGFEPAFVEPAFVKPSLLSSEYNMDFHPVPTFPLLPGHAAPPDSTAAATTRQKPPSPPRAPPGLGREAALPKKQQHAPPPARNLHLDLSVAAPAQPPATCLAFPTWTQPAVPFPKPPAPPQDVMSPFHAFPPGHGLYAQVEGGGSDAEALAAAALAEARAAAQRAAVAWKYAAELVAAQQNVKQGFHHQMQHQQRQARVPHLTMVSV